MKRRVIRSVVLSISLVCVGLLAYEGFSKIASVEPETGKEGDAVVAKGENLDKSKVGELLLTDGNKDFKTAITEQTDGEIKFKIPKAAAGRYHLMILTANKASMIEQPVVLTIE
jgi:hypothetical protein